jgi:hypothetical protein
LSGKLTPEDALALDEDELLARIGQQVGGRHAFPPSLKELIATGREWWNSNRRRLATIICGNKTIKALGREHLSTHERVVLLAEIADVVVHEVSGVEPALIGALAIREGLHRLCADHWK